MPSDASKKKKDEKKAKRIALHGGSGGKVPPSSSSASSSAANNAAKGAAALNLKDGNNKKPVLVSDENDYDIRIEHVCLKMGGEDLIVDSVLELYPQRRYGLVGPNGCGKSALLAAIGRREFPIPDHMKIYHLSGEIEGSDSSVLDAVICCDKKEKARLEDAIEKSATEDEKEDLYGQLDALHGPVAQQLAGKLLARFGFDIDMQNMKTQNFCPSWRMRIALARALFLNPDILLLDEPTNNLDFGACAWLESILCKFDRILIVISHSEDFLNRVCTHIIKIHNRTLQTQWVHEMKQEEVANVKHV